MNNSTVEATKQFSVPAEKVYKAWNDPEQLKQWWKPIGNQLKQVNNDLREGGAVEYIFDADTFTINGKYEEVKENQRLVYSWNWQFSSDVANNASYKLTVEFTDKDNGSEIKVKQENLSEQESVHPNEEGWDKGLSDLQAFLEGGNQHQGQHNEQGSNAEVAGYREVPDQLKVGGA